MPVAPLLGACGLGAAESATLALTQERGKRARTVLRRLHYIKRTTATRKAATICAPRAPCKKLTNETLFSPVATFQARRPRALPDAQPLKRSGDL